MNTDKELISFLNDEAEYITDSFYNTYRTSVADKYNRAFGKALRLLEEQQAEIQKKDKVIDEMAKALKEYANLGFLIKCPAEYDGKYNYKYCKIDITKDRTAKTNRLCIDCIKEYFYKKVSE